MPSYFWLTPFGWLIWIYFKSSFLIRKLCLIYALLIYAHFEHNLVIEQGLDIILFVICLHQNLSLSLPPLHTHACMHAHTYTYMRAPAHTHTHTHVNTTAEELTKMFIM